MGKRGQKHTKKGLPSEGVDPLSALIRPIPPHKRHELNQLVDKLIHLTSNYAQDATTPQQLWEEHAEIRVLVDKARLLEQCHLNRRLLGPRRSHVPALLQWLGQHGARIDGVEVVDFGPPEGLGLRVSRTIERGQAVVVIPRGVMMSVDTARQSEMGRLIEQDPMLKTMNNVTLALHLLLEKTSPASYWEPYINTLPQTYHTVLYYSLAELEALKGSPAYVDALKQFKFVARQYAYFYKKFQATMLKDYFTFDEYRWAVSTVMTRQNQIPCADDPEKVVNALIPFWDMANHENGEVSTDFDPDTDSVKCLAHRDFAQGDQFKIFYGERNNHDLLVHNGFVYPDNQHNSLQISLGISKNDPLAQDKFDILSRLVISPQGQFVIGKNPEKPLDQLLLAFLRVMNLQSQDQIERWSHEDKIRDLLNEHSEEALDRKIMNYMKTRCQLLKKSYPTTAEEDDEALANVDLPPTLRACVILRRSEKRILQLTIEYCDKFQCSPP